MTHPAPSLSISSARSDSSAPSPTGQFTDYLRELAAHAAQSLAAQGAQTGFDDDEVENFYAVARQLVGQRDLTRAHTALTRVCDLRPGEVRYLRALAVVRRELGMLPSAAALFQTVDLLEPLNPRNALDIAECWLRMGDMAGARKQLAMTQTLCEAQGLSTGRVPERARALIDLLDRQGVPHGEPRQAAAS